jgi:outer membrane protein assembly factor BamE (lipoprotein component of BamABCDE complex)
MTAASVKVATAMAGVALLAGCAGIHDHRGVVLDQELVSAVQPGTDNKDSVEKLLGRPSFVGEFTPNDWYYVSRDTTTIAFRNARVNDQTILHIRFDQAGNVASVDKTGKELVANISPSSDHTPTLGRRRTFLEDVFGNLGSVGSGPGAAGGAGGGDQGQ